MIVHAGVDAALAVVFHRMRCYADDRDGYAVPRLNRTYARRGLNAVHHRHRNIGENDRRPLAFEEVDRLGAVRGHLHVAAELRQHCRNDELIDRVVLRNEYFDAGERRFADDAG